MGQPQVDLQGQTFSDLLEEADYDYSRPKRGQVSRATVLAIDENEIIVDMGCKRDGIVPRTDLERLDESFLTEIQIGDQVPVCVLDVSGERGELLVSLNQGLARQDWLRAGECLETREVLDGEVIDCNRGGLIVSFGRLRGFVPNSHLNLRRKNLHGDRLREAKTELIGQTMSLIVIEADQSQRRLVLSQRLAGWHKRQEIFSELAEGEVRTGVVSNIVDFGVFVDLGGIDGLIHISELDWQHVNHPSDVLSVGEEIEVYVLKVERERERVGLSRKRLLPDPWDAVVEKIDVDQMVLGKVRNIVDFGVFVELGEGVEGLVHNSELPAGLDSAELEVGSEIAVRVLRIDRWRHRIALSLKDVLDSIALPDWEGVPVVLAEGDGRRQEQQARGSE